MRSPILKFLLTFAIVFLGYFFYQRNIADSSRQDTTKEVVEAKQSLPDDFRAFYEKFQSDSIYQINHIIWPLRRISDDTITYDDWTPENWKLHGPFNDMGGSFERSFIVSPTMVQEVIVDRTGTYSMERRFQSVDGDWRLIYYRPMGAYGQ